MSDAETREAMLAALAWQVELGADEPVGDAPVNRYAAPAEASSPAQARAPGPATAAAAPGPAPVDGSAADPVAEAEALAAAAATLEALAAAQAAYDRCELKRGARSFVFADGNPGARVMIVGEAPGREEDIEGRPFVGRAGQLLDRMFAAIGLSRSAPDPEAAIYITNVMPWRPPGNREPEPAEMAMMQPFLRRHVELAGPDILVLMGNTPCAALLGRRGITRLRGTWTEALGRPALPMTHPAYLLRNPEAKREAWADLLEIRARLDG
ncbi:MAG: uracil-DNA glycosylase [Rhodobacteraceae bacterium]|nr:uracil-DNA glycosylase [Paracoccaceae bacterium]